ncbi:MAG: hypothetical protein V4560_17400 [Bacteroidota bacterium]
MRKQVILTYLILVMSSFTYGRSVTAKDTIKLYFNLSTVKYKKIEQDNIVQIKTRRNVHSYVFTIPYAEVERGVIGFGGYDNPETGAIFEPVKTVPANIVKKIHFISLDKLADFIKSHANSNSYKLYFIERRDKKYYQYHVKEMGDFFEE